VTAVSWNIVRCMYSHPYQTMKPKKANSSPATTMRSAMAAPRGSASCRFSTAMCPP